jgi:hypothetical protein
MPALPAVQDRLGGSLEGGCGLLGLLFCGQMLTNVRG